MGCVSSNLLNHEDEFTQLGSSALGHHIVSLTSTTYGLLNLDPPSSDHRPLPPTPPSRFTPGSSLPSPLSGPISIRSEPEVINSWELMAGLDTDSFRFSPLHLPPSRPLDKNADKENSNPNCTESIVALKPLNEIVLKPSTFNSSLEKFERRCTPNGENRVVVYTTTLRGVRKTYEACNAVRAAIEELGVMVCERDISMDRGFKEELRELMKGKEREAAVPPQVFVNGRYVGGADEILRMKEEGLLGKLVQGLPKIKVGFVCDGCGGGRFLPCFGCNGSCKLVMVVKNEVNQKQGRIVVLRCPDCNENGLVLCPICS